MLYTGKTYVKCSSIILYIVVHFYTRLIKFNLYTNSRKINKMKRIMSRSIWHVTSKCDWGCVIKSSVHQMCYLHYLNTECVEASKKNHRMPYIKTSMFNVKLSLTLITWDQMLDSRDSCTATYLDSQQGKIIYLYCKSVVCVSWPLMKITFLWETVPQMMSLYMLWRHPG